MFEYIISSMDEETTLTNRNTTLNSISVIKPTLIVYLIILVIYFAVLVFSIIDLIDFTVIPYSDPGHVSIIMGASSFWFLEEHCYFLGAQNLFGDVWMFLLLSIIVLNFLLNHYHLLKNQKKGLLTPDDDRTFRLTVFDTVSVFLFCLFTYTVAIIHELKMSDNIDLDEVIVVSVLIVIPSCISIVILPRAINQPRFNLLLLIAYQVFFIGLIGSNVLLNPMCD